MADEGTFQFPHPVERGPKSYQEFKFITLWEAWAETPLWDVFSDATHVTNDPEEASALTVRALSELYRERLIEAFAPAFAEPPDQQTLDDAAFQAALEDESLRTYATSQGRAVAIRWTHLGEQWRSNQEEGSTSA
jgi:hypothetical protein